MPRVNKKKVQRKQLRKFSFTVQHGPELNENQDELRGLFIKWLFDKTTKWVFQLERGGETSGYHWQGRASFKKAYRIPELPRFNEHMFWKIESTNGRAASEFYCLDPDETYIAGPWSNKSVPNWIPLQFRKTYLPWQKDLRKMLMEHTERKIYYVDDPVGNIGKTIFAGMMEVNKEAVLIPASCASAHDMIQFIFPHVKDRGHNVIILDIPRCIKRHQWKEWIGAIEVLKSGKLYDQRYSSRKKYISSPSIVIFANERPPLQYATADRWIHFDPRDPKYDENLSKEQ